MGVAVQAGLPPDAIRSVFRGHPPTLPRAGEICRALELPLTIGACRPRPQSVDAESGSPIARTPVASADTTRAEHFAHAVDGRLADYFAAVADTYDKARTEAERKLLFELFSGPATSTTVWFTTFLNSGAPPITSFVSADAPELEP